VGVVVKVERLACFGINSRRTGGHYCIDRREEPSPRKDYYQLSLIQSKASIILIMEGEGADGGEANHIQQQHQEETVRFEDLTVDDDLPILDRIVRYSQSQIALQRLVHVKMLGETAELSGYVRTLFDMLAGGAGRFVVDVVLVDDFTKDDDDGIVMHDFIL
jgi:hypothetical protein